MNTYHQTFIADFLQKKLAKCPKIEEPHFINILKFISGTEILESKRLEAADFVSMQIRLAQRFGSIEETKIWRHILDLIAPPLIEIIPINQLSMF